MISQRKRGGGAIAFQNETLCKTLSKTDLLLAPRGHIRTEVLKIVKMLMELTLQSIANKKRGQLQGERPLIKPKARGQLNIQ
jgi:hypothetical protein